MTTSFCPNVVKLLLMPLLASVLIAQEVRSPTANAITKLKFALEALERASASGTSREIAGAHFELGRARQEINVALNMAGGVDWAHPSAKRREAIEQIGQAIQPFNHLLITTAFITSPRTPGAGDVRVETMALLDYTLADNVFRIELSDIACIRPPSGVDDLAAFRLLFEHRALNESLRDVLSARIRNEPSIERRRELELAAAEMGFVDEAISACEALVSLPFTPDGMSGGTGIMGDNQLTAGYRRAAEALLYLGTRAAKLVPLLEKRRDEIQAALHEKQPSIFTGTLYSAIMCLRGERPRKISVAKNGSGPLGLD